jgi:hypothetical protein
MVRLIKHKIITGLLLFFALGIVVNSVNAEGGPIKITAKELFAQCDANPIRANESYDNKLLEVSGIIYQVREDAYLEGKVSCLYGKKLTDGAISTTVITVRFESATDKKDDNVIIVLAPSEKSKAGGIEKGKSFVILGYYAGFEHNNVYLHHGKIK